MPTYEDFHQAFNSNTQAIFDMPNPNMAAGRHIVALANAATRKKRDEFTREITAKWKEGLAKLKVENDQMQKDLAAAFKLETQMNYEWLSGEMYEK